MPPQREALFILLRKENLLEITQRFYQQLHQLRR
jgi:hypothetical protein